MSYPKWFDSDWFARQKLAQMAALHMEIPAGSTPLAQLEAAIANWNTARGDDQDFTPVTVMSNFEACNRGGYLAGIDIRDINVSPSPFFDIPVYLTDLADRYNAAHFAADGYAAAGQWTAMSAMRHMFEVLRMSAWEHYKSLGMAMGVNPSNEFDTQAYLLDRASESGYSAAQLVSILANDGINPLQDYFAYGQAHGIAASVPAQRIVADMVAGEQWGIPVHLPDAIPMPDEIIVPGSSAWAPDIPVVKTVAVTAGETAGQDGEDTKFVAQAGPGGNITENSIIRGGANAQNALVMNLTEDWSGFAGVDDGNGGKLPNVVNVREVVINKTGSGANSFSAANISDDAKTFDINYGSSGNFALTDLSATVERVNVSNARTGADGAAPETSISFADGAQADNFCIGLSGMGTEGQAASVRIEGIENLVLESMGARANYISLGQLAASAAPVPAGSLENLYMRGSADLCLEDVSGAPISHYDGSAMKGNLRLDVNGMSFQSKVTGGIGSQDALIFNDYAEVSGTDIKGIEEIALRNGGEIDAANIAGLENVRIDGPTAWEISNLQAEALTVLMTDNAENPRMRTCAKGIVSGSIGDITWQSCGISSAGTELTADFVSNATGNCLIRLEGRDRIGVASVFELRELLGTITIEDPNPVGENGNGYNGLSVDGIKIIAEKATGLDINHNGSMKICGSLWSVKDVNVNLRDVSEGDIHNLFKLPDLPKAQNVNIQAGGSEIWLSRLGTQGNGGNVDMEINEARDVHIESIEGKGGSNVSAKIQSTGNVDIMDIDVGGHVALDITARSMVSPVEGDRISSLFMGRSLDLNFSKVQGDVGAWNGWTSLEASEGRLNYAGAQGADYIRVGALAANTRSKLATGAGDDDVVVQTGDSIGPFGKAILDVDLGAGKDALRVYNMNQKGDLLVNVAGPDMAANVIKVECGSGAHINDAAAANLALAKIGAGFELAADAQVNDGVFEHGGNAYWIAGTVQNGAAANVTLVACAGGSAEMFAADDL